MLDVSDSLQAETHRAAFYRLILIFCSHLKHPGKNIILLSCMELKAVCNSRNKMLLCILLPDFRHFLSPFTPPPASSQLWLSRRLSSSLHFTAWSSYIFVLSLLCVLAPLQALLFFCSYLTIFWQVFCLFQLLSLCLPASTTCWTWQRQWQQHERKNRHQTFLPVYGIPGGMVSVFIPASLWTGQHMCLPWPLGVKIKQKQTPGIVNYINTIGVLLTLFMPVVPS